MKLSIKIEELFPVFILAGFLLFIFLVISLCKPLVQNVKLNSEQRKTLVQETAALKKILASANQHKSPVHMVAADKSNELIDRISTIAHKNQIDFVLTSLKDTESKEEELDLYKKKKIKAHAIGNLKNFGHFLTELRNMNEGVVDFDKIVISGDVNAPSNITAQLTLALCLSKDNENK